MGELVKPLDCKSGSFRIASSSLASLNNWISLMFLTSSVFHIFSSLALISGTMVISSRNPIYSVLFLILTFFNLSCLLFILNIEFLPILFLIVYVGAIAVLFLFVLIMLNIKLSELKEGMKQYILISFIFGLIFHLWGFNYIQR